MAKGTASSPLVSPLEATRLLATMIGGYNVGALIELLSSPDPAIAAEAASGLSRTLLVYDAYHDVLELAETNPHARQVVDSWAAAEWFTARDRPGRGDHRHRVQGGGGDQHRRPFAGHPRHHPPGHPPARPGDAGDPHARRAGH